MKGTLVHESAHAMTSGRIVRGDFDAALNSNAVARRVLSRAAELSERGIYAYRIKEELAGMLAELAVSATPRELAAFIGIISVGGQGNDDMSYSYAAKIIVESLANDLNFSEYFFDNAVAEKERTLGRKLTAEELQALRAATPRTYLEISRALIPPQMVPHFIKFANALKDEAVRRTARKWYREFFGELPPESLSEIPSEVLKQHRQSYSDSAVDNAEVADIKTNENKAFDKGGIDLDPQRIDLKTSDGGGSLRFDIDPAVLDRFRKAPGVTPVIAGVRPLDSLAAFMEVPQAAAR
ncbi:MAG: hypothetical protein HGA80_05230 [Candidatus Omnitrophica bacterium]|nr:hypothetical protein [Candidatus Omnitrophota bacterium]